VSIVSLCLSSIVLVRPVSLPAGQPTAAAHRQPSSQPARQQANERHRPGGKNNLSRLVLALPPRRGRPPISFCHSIRMNSFRLGAGQRALRARLSFAGLFLLGPRGAQLNLSSARPT
jgi:hypothetical protein